MRSKAQNPARLERHTSMYLRAAFFSFTMYSDACCWPAAAALSAFCCRSCRRESSIALSPAIQHGRYECHEATYATLTQNRIQGTAASHFASPGAWPFCPGPATALSGAPLGQQGPPSSCPSLALLVLQSHGDLAAQQFARRLAWRQSAPCLHHDGISLCLKSRLAAPAAAPCMLVDQQQGVESHLSSHPETRRSLV